ncbi:20236_t:CDS:2 [Funneliformis geosporum]|uniref:Chitin synthase n=1 Tax=Funneliformis geosporum TaxID=1117311 RepID=A0A9W4WSR9_9GLOM|nr:20236_t:CDS:2 [Funneliformis geosporum]CAI2175937.1 970_t:CDS:2 [Funneliformis geosporum]
MDKDLHRIEIIVTLNNEHGLFVSGGFPTPQGVFPSPQPPFIANVNQPYPYASQTPQYPTQPQATPTPTYPHSQQSSSNSSSYPFPQQQQTVSNASIPLPQQNSSSSSQSTGSEIINIEPEHMKEKHYGAAPKVQPRRYKTQQVKLFEGNFVIECPVPSKLLSLVPEKSGREFTHVRYTACTCDPDEFQENKYTLRQELHETKRQTELFIVTTMYNEDEKLFARTFQGVVKNIHRLCKRERSRIWGKDGWKKVVVCIVSDGRNKINKRTQDYLAAIGVYQSGLAKEKVFDEDVTAHIFEYTTQLCLDPDMKLVGSEYEYTPVQILFCLKEKNQKKINSHRWFFNAFGRILRPNVCVLLDVGTRPGGSSIYHLWKAFDKNPYIGGACGEIVAMKGKGGKYLLNPLVASQNFEYKMSNILDKPLESVFGYITVLPGAFSAYRYVALENAVDPITKEEVGPLASYFMGERHHGGGPPKKKKISNDGEKSEVEEAEKDEIKTGLFTANMYLAEDRILCFELVSKRKSSWLLHYVKSAYAETDVPDTFTELISQRRRWLNGSFFAGVFAIFHTLNIWRSDHTAWRKTLLAIEMFYQSFTLLFSWFALGNFYLTFYILGNSLTKEEAIGGLWSPAVGAIVFNLLNYVYIALIILQFALALGNKPRSAKWAYVLSTYFFAGLMIYMLFAAGWLTYKGVSIALDNLNANQQIRPDLTSVKAVFGDFTFKNVIISLLSTYGLYFIASFMFFEPYHMFHSSIQYMMLVPFYLNVLNVYAFCNIHDVSWGTKGDTKAEKLGTVSKKKDSTAEVELPEDINEEYERVQSELSTHRKEHPRDKKNISVEEKEELREESNAMFRTYVVFFWIISNGALIAAITQVSPVLTAFNDNTQRSNTYFAFILWSVAGLAAVRFFGSCIYLLLRLFTENLFDGLIK